MAWPDLKRGRRWQPPYVKINHRKDMNSLEMASLKCLVFLDAPSPACCTATTGWDLENHCQGLPVKWEINHPEKLKCHKMLHDSFAKILKPLIMTALSWIPLYGLSILDSLRVYEGEPPPSICSFEASLLPNTNHVILSTRDVQVTRARCEYCSQIFYLRLKKKRCREWKDAMRMRVPSSWGPCWCLGICPSILFFQWPIQAHK